MIKYIQYFISIHFCGVLSSLQVDACFLRLYATFMVTFTAYGYDGQAFQTLGHIRSFVLKLFVS